MEVDEIQCSAELKFLPKLLNWVQKKIAEVGMKDEGFKIQLALEEGIVNVIQHGAAEERIEIKLVCRILENRQIEFDICDTGKPFNPLKHPKPSSEPESIEEMEIGGLGIALILKAMDSILYRREDPYNILTLVKKL